MKKKVAITAWLGWFLVAGASPAYANNPPAPDGMLSVLLIFPVAILGFRLAGAQLTSKEMKWRPVRIIYLALCAFVTFAGTAVGGLAMLLLVIYAMLRGGQAMSRGHGKKRFALGAAVILFAPLAGFNYALSTSNWSSVATAEASGAGGMRAIVTAQITFKAAAMLDANKNGIPEFGTLAELQQAGLVSDSSVTRPSSSYRYVLELTGDPTRDEKEYFLYATPKKYGSSSSGISLSLLNLWWPRPTQARRTFAADETGVIRWADLGGSHPVTREEAQKWQPIE
jgi:hypothetical protein